MKSRPIDPRARAAIEHLQANSKYWIGPILPRNLPELLPPHGDRRSWRDAITVFLMCELMGVHRVAADKTPYWRGEMYQVDRRDLARRYGCDPDDISNSLQWLKLLGLVFVIHRTRQDGVGKPCGTDVFAAPRMDRLKQVFDFFDARGRAMNASELLESDPLQEGSKSRSTLEESALSDGSALPEGSSYLNCAEQQQKLHAESGVKALTHRLDRAQGDDRRSFDPAGGGGVAADMTAQMPPKSSAATAHPASSSSNFGHSSVAASPRWTVPQPPVGLTLRNDVERTAWEKASIFCALWEQAIMRLNHVVTCATTIADKKSAFKFFLNNPQTSPLYSVAVAINAWSLTDKPKVKGWDRLYHVRTGLELQSFLRSLASGKLESEIGQRLTIDAWADLRLCFTQSELIYFHWPASKVPIVALPTDAIWEMDLDAPDYYRKHKLNLPPEISEPERLRQIQPQQQRPEETLEEQLPDKNGTSQALRLAELLSKRQNRLKSVMQANTVLKPSRETPPIKHL